MGWKESHKQESRQRILNAAAELFTRKGFNQVGIDEVMQTAGMTRGAFYAHFTSKHELYDEAIISAGIAAVEHFNKNSPSLDDLIHNYLSNEHLSSNHIRCPMACLVSDVAHNDKHVKDTYTKMLKGFSGHLKSLAHNNINDEKVLLQAVLLIGGMAIARSVTDKKLSEQILSVCCTAAKEQINAH